MSLLNLEVTRRRLRLGTADSTTGWYAKSWNTSTIEMLIIPRAARELAMAAGVAVRTDAMGLTCDGVLHGDEILTSAGVYYEVKGIRDHWVADSFMYREVDLTLLPTKNLSYSPASPTVNDARYNTKDYLETRITDSNMQDENGRNLRWIACYSNPDYPWLRVFTDKHMEIIFTIDSPDSTALMQGDQTPYGYEERVPIHIVTLDTEVNHLAEVELREITKEYSTGSQRALERRGQTVHNYGSTQVYDTEFLLNYRRGTT